MRPNYRFTGQAIRALEDVVVWTHQNFGEAQADRYRDALLDRLNDVCAGKAHLRRLDRLTGIKGHKGLLTVKSGRHLVVLKPEPDALIVLDILHEAQDIGNYETKDE